MNIEANNMISEGGPVPVSYPVDRMRYCRKQAKEQARLRKRLGHPAVKVAEWLGYARYWNYRIMGLTHAAAVTLSVVAVKPASPSSAVPCVPMDCVTGGVA